MRALGVKVAAQLQAGDILVLRGNLGAGKTAFTQGIGRGLGITDITSPTFVIARTHRVKNAIPLIHVDAYRLLDNAGTSFEIDDLDLDTSLEEAITIIEWGEEVAARLTNQYLLVDITFGADENQRHVEFVPHGARWDGFKL